MTGLALWPDQPEFHRQLPRKGNGDDGLTWYVRRGKLGAHAFEVDALFVAPPGPRTFQLEVGLYQRADTSQAASYDLDPSTSISVMSFPFGPSGGNTPF